jgi:two-component system response regulator ChvI
MRVMNRILIVDDETDINLLFKIVLEDRGFKVDTFDDPNAALENYRAGLYDLLILDIKMPRMHGFELYRKIREIDNKVKVCFLTASEMYYEMFRKNVFNTNTTLEENRFIQTPIENEELVKQVNYMLSSN